jgi:hypothetical protein
MKKRRPENPSFLSSRIRSGLSGLAPMVLMLTFFSFFGCKNTTGPGSFEINMIAYNSSGVAVDIYLDGDFRISIESGLNGTITGVSSGAHLLDVKQKGTEVLIVSLQVEITENNDYTWIIEGPSSIKITNNYGETLQIYSGNTHMGDLGDQETQTITEVPFGEHVLTAVKLSDQVVAGVITITVTEVKEYAWVITP